MTIKTVKTEYICCDRCGATNLETDDGRGDFTLHPNGIKHSLLNTRIDQCDRCSREEITPVQNPRLLRSWGLGYYTEVGPILEALGQAEFNHGPRPSAADFAIDDESYQYLSEECADIFWAAGSTREEIVEAIFLFVRGAFNAWREYKHELLYKYYTGGFDHSDENWNVPEDVPEECYYYGLEYWGLDFHHWTKHCEDQRISLAILRSCEKYAFNAKP